MIGAALVLVMLSAQPDAPAQRRAWWLRQLVTPSERFFAQPLPLTLFPTQERGAFSNAPGVKPGTELDLQTVFCTADRRKVPARVHCTGELPARTNADDSARVVFDDWLEAARRCGVKVNVRPAEKAQLASAAKHLLWGRAGQLLGATQPNAAMFVGVTHLSRERVRENECSHHKGRMPCDPISSWGTDRFTQLETTTFELVTGSGGAPLEDAFRRAQLSAPTPMFGRREGGWFVPDPVFDVVFAERKPQRALKLLLAKQSADADEQLALHLARAIVAQQAGDVRAGELARTFLAAAESRPLESIHFELRPTILQMLPVLRQVATGRYSHSDPCAER